MATSTSEDQRSGKLHLENGDHLSREEFFRRWENTPEVRHAELINGVVYVDGYGPGSMNAALRSRYHSRPHGLLQTWMGIYRAATNGIQFDPPTSLILGERQVVEPDGILTIDPTRGGTCHWNEEGYLVGPPEFVVEVSASIASRDLHDKIDLYHRAGVREYLVWQVLDSEIHWFVSREKEFVELSDHDQGVLKSIVLPGLWLDRKGLLDEDYNRVLETLQQGLDSSEHQAFVRHLQSQKTDQ